MRFRVARCVIMMTIFYGGHYDDKPDYFYYDDPGDFDSYPSVYGFVGPDNYELHQEEGAVALHRTGSDETVNIVLLVQSAREAPVMRPGQ